MPVKLYEACAYVILDEDKLLAADRGWAPSAPIIEAKPWTAVTKWLCSAKAREECVPFVVWDAKNVHRWLGWGLLVDAEVKRRNDGLGQTEFRFQKLRPLDNHRRSDFVLLEQQRPLSDDFIRSYARLSTPDFLRELARHDGQLLLSDWLRTPEAVAHAFRTVYEDENEHREAEEVLARAIALADEVARGAWGIILTPGRIRLVVGECVVVEVGYDGYDFWFDPDSEVEKCGNDADLSLAELFTSYERDFRVHLEKLHASHRNYRNHDEVARDYLVTCRNIQAPLAAAEHRRSHADAVLEYLHERGCLPVRLVV